MAESFPPSIAPQTDSSGNAPESAQQSPDPAEPVPITEQEVGEYREQDRYLPVSPFTNQFPPHRERMPRGSALATANLAPCDNDDDGFWWRRLQTYRES
jgi:hypothetical protein